MKVKFNFTDSPRGSRTMMELPGVQYEVHDSQGNIIIQASGGIHDIAPGDYCIYGTRLTEGNEIYFGEEKFNIPEGDPGGVRIVGPGGAYHRSIMVYMDLIPLDEMDPTSCEDMWGYEEDQAEGGAPWLLIGLLVIMALGSGA